MTVFRLKSALLLATLWIPTSVATASTRVTTGSPIDYARLSGDLHVHVFAQEVFASGVDVTVLVDRIDVTRSLEIDELFCTRWTRTGTE